MKVYTTFLVAHVALVMCYCPPDKIHNVGHCAFHIHCINNIRGISLPNECQEAANYPVTVDVTLTDAIERFDENIDVDSLGFITTLKISGRWKETELAILQHTTKLQNLYLSNDHIERINGSPFYYLNRLEVLDLTRNRLTDISELFEFAMHPNKLRKLSLACNAIEEIPGDAFEELTSLTELDLSYNFISDLYEEPFYNLTNLEVLKLTNNRIKDLNGAINNLQNLKHLYLRGNQIEHVDMDSLKIIQHLEIFDLSRNQLEDIKPVMFSRHWEHFGNYSSLCKIMLSENHIVRVPNATSKDISFRVARHSEKANTDIFTELDLSKNSISNIEYDAFQSLEKLMSLDLSNNKVIDFIVNANDLAYMKYLNLSGNYISHLYYASFYSMSNLQNLDLSYNKLDYIPKLTFNNNFNLKFVNMTYNEFEKLDSIHIPMFHPQGGVLDLSNNGLFKLIIPVGEGIRLVTLYLHSNNISDPSLINLKHQNDLRFLDLSHNLISELNSSSLYLPMNIMYLNLNFNKIQRIGPSAFQKLGHLLTLRLGHNCLSTLEYGMFQGLTALEKLDLSHNKIGYLDSKMLLDLKSLKDLSLRANGLNILDYKNWYGHKVNLQVFLDDNNITCAWLATALNDYNNGFSGMIPTVLVRSTARHSLEGIPCVPEESQPLTLASPNYVMVDERLLVTSQKILEAVREQNLFLKRIVWHTLSHDLEEVKKEKPLLE